MSLAFWKDKKLPTFSSLITDSLARKVLMIVATLLVSHGWLTSENSSVFVDKLLPGVMFLAELIWTYVDKQMAVKRVEAAQMVDKPATPHEIESLARSM